MCLKCLPLHFSNAHVFFVQNLHEYFSSDLPKQNQENKKKISSNNFLIKQKKGTVQIKHMLCINLIYGSYTQIGMEKNVKGATIYNACI